jgi:hypothetical protein
MYKIVQDKLCKYNEKCGTINHVNSDVTIFDK